MNTVTVQHLQSATQIVDLGGVKILTDPWLTDGEYYGSWYHYPPFGEDNIDNLEYDLIYVSHIHPDHLSQKTFKKLPYKRPVLIHQFDAKFLKYKLEAFGFEVIECTSGNPYYLKNGASITIYAADNCNPDLCAKFFGCAPAEKNYGATQIDTFSVFEFDDTVIVNTNDCPFELASETIKANKICEKKIDLLLVGYCGAGPYPQCFEFETTELKVAAAKAKEKEFLQKSISYINLLKPSAFAPYAGTYVLGSRLSKLMEYRGVPTLEEALIYINKRLATNSLGILLKKLDLYNVKDHSIFKDNGEPSIAYIDYMNQISSYALDYDSDDWDDLELNDLLMSAYERFRKKAEEINFASNTKLVIQSESFAFEMSVDTEPKVIPCDLEISEPHVRIKVGHNLLHRLVRGPRYAHWNNAEIGSHLHFHRKPAVFERGLYHCMCFFHC